ncbi:flagellin [Aquamicrobium defluvii]|uniref:Flagellin n=1 Tax=Aquamicrobium defluvii TaxID=69279 RepID=A0A011TD11_9HYPH|nr:flagellin [Aquamicrobium defluvii]EXL09514.1 flagellar protein FlaD [Aquamicrobium defluvii]EZQ16452.1 flagellar protein FlaD [Halopseudomonas bauzanensis]TDR34257.1 flagellin [Aquamicrobium defluvii]
MASIMTNSSALTALQSLNATNKALETTQSRISTGYRVATASDNAAYWSIATTMRSDNKANSVVQDSLGLGAGKIDTAYTAMNKAIEVVDKIKEKVLLAKTAGTEDRAKIQAEIATYQAQLKDNIGGANYAGSNLLKTDSTSTGSTKLSVITSYNRDDSGNVSTGTIDVNFGKTRLIDSSATEGTPAVIDNTDPLNPVVVTPAVPGTPGNGILDKVGGASGASILNIDVSDVTGVTGYSAADEGAAFDKLLTDIESALSSMSTGAAELGAAKARIDLQSSFVSSLSDSIDKGVGQLVDADMNKESTRLQALQVQQQLGIQALSIANGNSQQILSLFR